MKKQSLFILSACAVLTLSACKKEEQATAPAPAPAATSVVLPDGMPPQPEASVIALPPHKAPASPAPSVALQKNGQPVDPYCFVQTWEQNVNAAIIDLNACEDADNVRVADSDQYTPSDGFVGTAYRPAGADAENMPAHAYIEYKYLGDVDGDAAVLIRESGGGTGQFTSLYLFKRVDDTLQVTRNIAGGDRCNGGIESAALSDGALRYSINLTPMALYAQGGGRTDGMDVEDLPDCATCCYAQAHYNNETLESISLDSDLPNLLSQRTLGGADAASCFDTIVQGNITAGETNFTPEQLAAFTTRIQTTCLSATAPADTAPAADITTDSALPSATP
ncbi:MAG: hypothetical protein KKA05_02310 [Alphaproteobacteria bacterium]|nr:hypothetical protein [Alphaproteobacteria bacterium]MBU0860136.1 hypothetical protein [Alphaproteobacteria bacterium]